MRTVLGMQFKVFPKRQAGKLLPKHVMWAGEVVGDLFIQEVHDAELGRHVRQARVMDGQRELLPPMLDAMVVAAKPDFWTMTGWERGPDALGQPSCAFQQSWILIPVDQLP